MFLVTVLMDKIVLSILLPFLSQLSNSMIIVWPPSGFLWLELIYTLASDTECI